MCLFSNHITVYGSEVRLHGCAQWRRIIIVYIHLFYDFIQSKFCRPKKPIRRSRWLRGLMCRSASGRCLGLRVQIPPGGGGMDVCFVNVVCCQVEVSTTVASFVQSVVCLCVISELAKGSGLGSSWAVAHRPPPPSPPKKARYINSHQMT